MLVGWLVDAKEPDIKAQNNNNSMRFSVSYAKTRVCVCACVRKIVAVRDAIQPTDCLRLPPETKCGKVILSSAGNK